MNLVRADYDPIELAYELIRLMKETYPKDFKWNKGSTNYWVDQLWGNDHFRTAIGEGKTYSEFHSSFIKSEADEKKRIEPYLLY